MTWTATEGLDRDIWRARVRALALCCSSQKSNTWDQVTFLENKSLFTSTHTDNDTSTSLPRAHARVMRMRFAERLACARP